ncbi:hypothetical protein H5968_07425 [Sphaerospermopsis sp. LEGE 00249]|uniref:hypothetical protein n=1 Tax=Sphaerospermopsis sp. LEGE 00249 TaxID=1380707 RepID=UPI00164E5CE5|nr:hypothetical protein [Sphaerospermopsis sp. LEGE 00249]MBC5794982.1 hypothetical protein [Sphaerospermopsis sp. LEGE 00249]
MNIQKSVYEASLAEYSNHIAAIALLKNHRPYWEMIPSLRRPSESVITITLPVVRLRDLEAKTSQTMGLPCDIAMIMCDPEWKIKTDVEILLFIHRPDEDFSDFLGRWRQTQVLLDKQYEWIMHPRHSHILSEGANNVYPLFVIFPETLQHIQRGLIGADLPFVMQTPTILEEEKEEYQESYSRSQESGVRSQE